MIVISNYFIFKNFEQFYKDTRPVQSIKALKTPNINIESPLEKDVEVCIEESITLIINEKSRLNLICTPQMVEELIIGYIFTEGICSSIDQVKEISYLSDKIFLINISKEIKQSEEWFQNLEIRSSGCVGLKNEYLDMNFKINSKFQITPKIIFKSQEILKTKGIIWQKSGGTHMSGLFNSNGNLITYSEDIGRHNTIDKIIGFAIIRNYNLSNTYICTSGRLSAGMVAKVARVGIPILISISAPIFQGIKLAKKLGVTLIGFSRDPALNIYSHEERIKF